MRNCFLYLGVFVFLLLGCKTSKPVAATEPAVQTIGGKPVSTSEFEYVYNKNNSNADNAYTQASIQEYLELYTNFKLKVMDAESRGLDTTKAFKTELDGYKQQLAQPYLTEKSVTEKLIREAYDRMQKEVNASHILINVSPEAEPKDTLLAYNKILDIRKRILAGENFDRLATTYSEDVSAKENKGSLGYFTSLQMVYPFEDAAYKTPPGQISNPIRTKYGYHVIKVNNVRPAQGEIKVAHIMVRATPGLPKADSVTAKKKIDEIYARLNRKENWDKLVVQFSEDASSAQNGGELPWFGTGRMIPSFEEIAFNLTKPGEIAPPVLTPYGWHIIKLIERRSLPPYEEMETNLRNRVAKDSRSELNKTAFLKRIRLENNFKEMAEAKAYAFSKADSAVVKGTFKNVFPERETAVILFTIKDKKYTLKDFFTYVEQNQKPRKNISPAHAMNLLYEGFTELSLLNYEKENLENKYVDYKMLVREYRDGILLFQLMDEKVWSKAIEDTIGLKTFFQNNREKYKWDTRAEATLLSASSREILTKAQQALANGKFEVKKEKPSPILFDTGKKALNGPAIATLENVANQLSADTSLTVTLTGFVDRSENNQKKNSALGQQRAEQVLAYLLKKEVPANQIILNKVAKNRVGLRGVTLALHSSDVRVLEQTFNETNPLALQAMYKRFIKGENKILDGLNWQIGTQTLGKDGRFYYVQIRNILPPALKELNETRGIVTSDYQNYLEKEWLAELRQRYPVVVNQAEVDKLIKK